MFRVFTVVLYVSFLSLVPVDSAIDLRKESLGELTITTQYANLHRLAKTCSQVTGHHVFEMKLHKLDDKNVTCNDGTAAGYYIRRAHGSKRWIVYLEGGGFCNSAASCEDRYSTMKDLMSSDRWGKYKSGTGILSPHPHENPTWWNANHVYIPYCSSDAWSGNAFSWQTGERFSFLGTKILEKVFKELMYKGLYHAKHLLLAGSSAGGIGVILSLDRLARRLQSAGLKVQVRGLADSGWYVDSTDCSTGGRENCLPTLPQNAAMILQGMNHWRGVVPDDCARRNPTKKWKCYFGEHVYRTDSKSPKHAPLFVFQWLYDIEQLKLFGISSLNPNDVIEMKRNTQLALSLGEKVKKSFNNTEALACAVFAPSCIAHTILMQDDWLKVEVGGKNLNEALDDWYQSSGQGSASCKSLIESECQHPNCGKTCSTPRWN